MRLVGLLAACWLLASCQRPPVASEQPPAPRIVTLAPHLAELAVTAGAEPSLVGVSAYSDFPARIAELPVVSDGFRIDAEALLSVRPTLALVWGGGGQVQSMALLDELGIPYEIIETRRLSDIGPAIRRIGELAGSTAQAVPAAAQFAAEIESLAVTAEDPLSVFYQIGNAPIYTVNRDHFISDLIARCGGRNLFAEVATRVPSISLEAVVRADPAVILTGSGPEARALWQRFPAMTAVRAQTVLSLPADQVVRPSARLVDGGRAICAALTLARQRLEDERLQFD